MKRVLLTAPATITWDALSPEQQAAINSVFGQFTLPMPGTQPYTGNVVIDAVTGDNFDPAEIALYELPFVVIGLWQWSGSGSTLTEITPLDAGFIHYLPPTHTYDEQGDVVSETPAVLHEPHRWSGWPELFT